MTAVNLPLGLKLGHRAGFANYRGDVRMVGQVCGPTTYGRHVVATDAAFDPAADRTRVEFRFIDRDEPNPT